MRAALPLPWAYMLLYFCLSFGYCLPALSFATMPFLAINRKFLSLHGAFRASVRG